jgi:hypothetical protein
VRAIRVLLVILLSVPLLMMTAGASILAGQDFIPTDVSGMMSPTSLGALTGTGSGIPTSIGFSMPDFALPTMPSSGQFDASSFTMPDTNVKDLMGQAGVSSLQDSLDQIGTLAPGITDVRDFVTLPW